MSNSSPSEASATAPAPVPASAPTPALMLPPPLPPVATASAVVAPTASGTTATSASAPLPNLQDGNNGDSSGTAGAPSAPAAPSPVPMSELATLRARMQTLTELNSRLQALRPVPAQLLRPPGSHGHGQLETTLLTHGFRELAAVADVVRSERVQDALRAARRSEQADPSGIGSNLRRENLKRRRPPSPESPQPYREKDEKENASLLPPIDPMTVPVSLGGLPAYIREYNKSSKNKLHVVAPKKGRELRCPVTLRFMAPNVTTVYLTLDHPFQGGQALVVENATAIGSREQKPAHSQSDFMAFQQLSQQLAKVIRSDPLAPLQSYVELLSSYERLFVDSCSNCQRVISAEGHVPPVVRRRLTSSADTKPPRWDARHVMCKYEPPPPQPAASGDGTEAGVEGGGEGGNV